MVAGNRRAYRDYEILDTFECGLVLRGSEVKSLRDGKVQLADAHARIVGDEAWLIGLHIASYAYAHGMDGHVLARDRKLLLHRSELDRIRARLDQERLALVPLSLYFKDGRAKLELGIGRGRKKHDKRHAIAERDAARDVERSLARSRKHDR